MYYKRLRDLREDSDLTQTQLAEKLGMHKTTYTNYEQGKRDLPLQVAIKIAKFYGVSLDYLAGISNDPDVHTIKTKK
ncbi:MAG: helix-turn-helix transcriptional regulator [Ruminococcaceae bacterium]|nr:helix-turn-helix transcriptional regulator [Oscillospiraceae bacterium]